MTTNGTTTTHEDFIQRVRELVLEDCSELEPELGVRLAHTKLLYGVGTLGIRGVCIYNTWRNGVGKVDVVEVSAMTQESWVQLASTVIHELAHVVTGSKAGHSKEWKLTAKLLGFTKQPDAGGQRYHLSMLRPSLREAIARLAADIADGRPDFWGQLGHLPIAPRPCSAGIGSRGGHTRGKGSGSRLRLWECGCPKPLKIRVANDDIDVTCNRCGADFVKVER